MPLVYTSYEPLALHNIRNLLERAGIESALRNEHLAAGAGELPLTEVWGEIWVDEADAQQALGIIEQLKDDAARPAWVCARCGEHNEGAFDLCWQCEHPHH